MNTDMTADSALRLTEAAGGAGDAVEVGDAVEEQISGIIAEFSEILAFSRTRWTAYASDVHPDLKGPSLMLLQMVSKRGPVTATGISQILDMDKAIVSRHVTKLRELGLVDAEPAAEDRRVVLLTVTPHASELLGRVRERWAHAYHERLGGWSSDDLEVLREGLHRFNASAHEFHVGGPAGRCTRDHRSEGFDRSEGSAPSA